MGLEAKQPGHPLAVGQLEVEQNQCLASIAVQCAAGSSQRVVLLDPQTWRDLRDGGGKRLPEQRVIIDQQDPQRRLVGRRRGPGRQGQRGRDFGLAGQGLGFPSS